VPDEVAFHSKWELALELLDNALTAGVRARVVLADSGYGDTREFRNAIRELDYAVGVHHPTRVWRPGTEFSVPPKTARKGPPRRNAHAAEGTAVSIGELAKELTYRTVTWREGTRGKQSSRFAAARVRTSHKHTQGAAPGPEEWLLCEWPSTESAPSKHYLLSLPAAASVRELVRTAKLRWRVERDYQDLKGEVGLDHFEGRSWAGFHHHAALCSAAHAFLALRRALFPPEPAQVDAADGASPPPGRAAAKLADVSAMSASV
jgi:SRSO17 transposase